MLHNIRGLIKFKVKFHYLQRNPIQQVNLILAVDTVSVILSFFGFTQIWETLRKEYDVERWKMGE